MTGLRKAVTSGSRADALAAIRDRLASELEGADTDQVPALVKQLREVLAELDSLPAGDRESKSDDLARARAARRAASKGAPPAGGDLLDGRGGSG